MLFKWDVAENSLGYCEIFNEITKFMRKENCTIRVRKCMAGFPEKNFGQSDRAVEHINCITAKK